MLSVEEQAIKLLKRRARGLRGACALVDDSLVGDQAKQALREAAAILEDAASECSREYAIAMNARQTVAR